MTEDDVNGWLDKLLLCFILGTGVTSLCFLILVVIGLIFGFAEFVYYG